MLVDRVITEGTELKEIMSRYDRDYFSLDACNILVEMYNEFDDVIEVDPIGISCVYSELTPKEIIRNYGWEDEFDLDNFDDDELNNLLEKLNYRTFAVLLDNGFILFEEF